MRGEKAGNKGVGKRKVEPGSMGRIIEQEFRTIDL